MSASDANLARRLRLRGRLPVPVRLSRRTLAALAGLAAVGLAAVIGWSLSPHLRRPVDPPAAELAAPATPAALRGLPSDYAALPRLPPPPPDAPKLGPPLPGDLGRPILEARGASPDTLARADPGVAGPQKVEASSLFAPSPGAAEAAPAPPAPPAIPASVAAALADPVPTDRRGAFVSAAPGPAGSGGARLRSPSSPYLLQAGTLVPAVLVTGIRSDLPGPVVAQVAEDVYDSVHGQFLLVPRGARLLGTYDSQVAFGQDRVLVAWTRLVMPDGRAIDLPREPAADAQGYAGLSDEVDHKWKQIGGAAAISTLLGVGTQAGAGAGDSQIVQALRNGAAGALNQAGQQLVGKSLEVQPTLTIRPGFPVRLLLTHDLVLEPPGAAGEGAIEESGLDGGNGP